MEAEKLKSRQDFKHFIMKKQSKKIGLNKTTVTQLNKVAQEQLKGGYTFTFLNCLSRGDCGAGTGVLCY